MLSAFVISTAREVRKTNSKHVTDPALVLGFSLQESMWLQLHPKARTQQPEGERHTIPLPADQQFLSILADFIPTRAEAHGRTKQTLFLLLIGMCTFFPTVIA